MKHLPKICLVVLVALTSVGCAIVPAYDGYYGSQVTVVAPVPRYYVAPVPRYYVVPGRPHYHHHRGGHRW